MHMMARMTPPSTHLKGTITTVLFQMIGDKDFSPYDVSEHLKKYRGKGFDSPMELVNDDGFNILHEMVDKGRLSLFIVVVAFGWWNILSKHRVPEKSLSEHKGCTALQIAEKKRTRKPAEEVKHYTDWEKSLTPLMKSCRSGDVAKVKVLLNNSTDLEETFLIDFNGWNALHWAVVNGNVEIMQLLLDAGVDASAKTKKNETILHIACIFGQSNVIIILVQNDKCRLDPFTLDISNKSPYDRVAENGDIETLNQFLKCGQKPNSTFVVLASFSGRQKCLEYCIETLKLDVNGTDLYDRTALLRACESKKQATVKYLLKNGADIKKVSCTKRNILHIIAEAGCVSIFGIIIEVLKYKKVVADMINERDRYNGVELCFLIRGRDKGRDAWHYVEVKRHLVPIFLKKTRSGNVDVALFGDVLKSGWGVNPDQDNISEIEEMFKERRLNQNAALDMTPLHIAMFKGHTDLAKLLLDHGANPNIKDSFQLTPLMVACSHGNFEMVKVLEKVGAMFDEATAEGKTAVKIADDNEHDDIVKYINGMDFFQVSENFARGQLAHYREELSRDKLELIRGKGQDVKQHVVNLLRDMKIDINQCLEKLGSGPIVEATEE